ncbi:MAG: 50S ribosomal protein L29 [Gammaproteobacteria bacterium]|nr:50S ribosomal protein L29 [Gammaproteobacteria bacterium]MDA7971673.1 50S ribosomal protein L29 [Gammaproteobacteria bacterium]MDA7990532.1 50S ribosomal protein L29 [Gammaproteobacteria bacterium]MDA8024240.1 50S ribosomal protein L29 [Gammaproteobacteria bacterium]CAJ2376160.1 MAG: 50S ribosomal subunit protein L29 [Arenicellales bacterium IbO2]
MNAADLRAKSAGDLRGELAELRREQFNLRMQRGAGQLANPMRFGAVRKDIARIKTVLAEKARADGAARPKDKESKAK